MDKTVVNWLLEGDPAIRWQTKRDILAAAPDEYETERKNTASAGWGAALLSYRGNNGLWVNEYYSPKWISTTYTMLLLKRIGLPQDNPPAVESANILLNKGLYKDGGINYFQSMDHSETCVTGMILNIGSYFDTGNEAIHSLADWLINQQMADGGWNCESFNGARHSSFHTTVNVLEGLLEYSKRIPEKKERIENAFKDAVEFLLMHKLFRSDKTGEIIDKRMTRFSFPPRWHYDIMRILYFFAEAGIPYDDRMEEAFTLVIKKARDGRWPLQNRHPGRTYFDMEHPGKPSRWNTLRALRILEKYNFLN